VFVGRPTVLFAGIMLQSAVISSATPGSSTPPLHLGVAAPADAVLALLESTEAQALAQRVSLSVS
jgi:hypothetical protein